MLRSSLRSATPSPASRFQVAFSCPLRLYSRTVSPHMFTNLSWREGRVAAFRRTLAGGLSEPRRPSGLEGA